MSVTYNIGLWCAIGGAGLSPLTPRGINKDVVQHGYEWLGSDACPYPAAAQRVGATRVCFWLPAGNEGWGSFDLASFSRLDDSPQTKHLTPQSFANGAAAMIRRCPLVTDVDVYLGFVLAHGELWPAGNDDQAKVALAKENLFAVHLLRQLLSPMVKVHVCIDTLADQPKNSPTRTIAAPAVIEWGLNPFGREPWPTLHCPDVDDPDVATLVNENFIPKLLPTYAYPRSKIKGPIWPFMIAIEKPRTKNEYLRTAGRALKTFGNLYVEPGAPVTKAELLAAANDPRALLDAATAYPPLTRT